MRFNNRFKKVPLRASPKAGVAISALFLFLLLSSFFVTPALATLTVTSVTSTAVANQGILPNSPPTALLRVEITASAGSDIFQSITASLIDVEGLTASDISRISIYEDYQPSVGSPGDGLFTSADVEIAYIDNPDPLTNILINIPGNRTIPLNGAVYKWYYFIVVETSGSISHADAFQGRLEGIVGSAGGNLGTFVSPESRTSNAIRCECKVVDIYYTESNASLFTTWNLVANAYETYWKPNYLSHGIVQEMTEPKEFVLSDTHLYSLSEAWRYSKLGGAPDVASSKAAASNFLKFERRRKLMGMNVPTAVLGVKVAGKNQWQDATYYDTDYLQQITIVFKDTPKGTPPTYNFDPEWALFGITSGNEAGSGVAVYRDTNKNGVFNEGVDQVLSIVSRSWSGWGGVGLDEKTLTLNFSGPAVNPQAGIPKLFDADLDDNTGHDTKGVDFLVVLRGNPAYIEYGADFTAKVSGMDFVGADNPPVSADWHETREIKAVFELFDYTGTRVDPNTTFPVIGINLNKGVSPATLTRFTFFLKKTNTNFNPADDLTAPGVTVLSRTGAVVPTTTSGWSDDVDPAGLPAGTWAKTIVTFVSAGTTIPGDDTGVDSGPDYFVNLTTNSNFGYKKQIVAAIRNSEFVFGSPTRTNAAGTALTTNANVDHGSNERVYPEINLITPENNPMLGNPAVVFSQVDTKIRINSNPAAIIGIELAANTSLSVPAAPVELKSLVVQIADIGGGFLLSGLAPMTTDSNTSGLGVWLDNGNGVFGAGDTARALAFPPTYSITEGAEGYYRYLLVLQTPLVLPTSGASKIFVTLRSSGTMSATDAIDVRIWGSEITPCSSYGLGFRPTDANVTSRETSDYTVNSILDSDTLRLASSPGGSPPLDYSRDWYLVITSGSALGQVYRVVSVSGTDVTVAGADGTDPGLTYIGSVTAVRFFKVDSTSYQRSSAPVACSGIYSLNIIKPSSAGELPTAGQYTIYYNADAPGGTPLTLYRVRDLTYTDTTLIDTGLSVGSGQTYLWDTNTAPAGTYRIYGVLGSAPNTVTNYSSGTVTIDTSPPTVTGPLTISPTTITIGATASINLGGIEDVDSDTVFVTFYSVIDGTGADTRFVPGSFTVLAPYPKSITVSWNTSGMPAGTRQLFAQVSDGGNKVIFPVSPAKTTFILQTASTVTGTAVSMVLPNQGILPKSPLTAIFGLNLTSTAGDPLNSVTVKFTDVSGFNDVGGSDTELTEVAVYRDSGGAGAGIFDSSDTFLGSMLAPSFPDWPWVTIPILGGNSIPINDTGFNAGIDYFIAIRTSDTMDHATAFFATVYEINGILIDGVYGISSGTIQCECKIVDVFYTQSFHFESLIPPLVSDPWNRYLMPNYIGYSIRTEMTEPNYQDPAGDPHPWYLADTGNYRYSYTTGGPLTGDDYREFTRAYSNLLKFERKRQLLQMQVPTAILGIKVAGRNERQVVGDDNEYLGTLVVEFTDADGSNFNARDMLFPLNVNDDAQSGVALYQDNNHNGILDDGDAVVNLYNSSSVLQWNAAGNQVTFDFYGTSIPIPQTYDAEGGGDTDGSWNITYSHDRTGTDFLFVIRARPQTTLDSKIKYGADFTARITRLTLRSGIILTSDTRKQWYGIREIKAVLELSDYTGSRVDPNSTFPLIGINVVDGPGLYEKIYKITLQLKDEVGFDPNIDIADVLIYRGATIQPGITRSDWVLVGYPIGAPTEWWWQTVVSAESGLDVPDTDSGLYQGDDYYVALQTSEDFGYLDKITGRILDGGIEFSGTTTSAAGTGLTTNALLPPVSNNRVNWNPFASPETPLVGNVGVKFYDLITTPFLDAGGPTAVLGLELSSNTDSDTQPVLKSLVVQLINRNTDNGALDMNDLAPMTIDSNTSGLGIWKDVNDNGRFDTGIDMPLTMAAPPTQSVGTAAENYQRFILVLDEAQPIDTSFSSSGNPDYFITINTKNTVSGDQFIMRLWGSEMKPPASYALGFRVKNTNVTGTEAVTYGVSGQTTTPTSTLTINPALGGNQPDYSQNWYLVVTGENDTAKGVVRKVLGVNAARNIVTCEDLSGLGIITQIRVFKLDSASYQNHSVGVAFKRASAVTLFASSTTAAITLTWVDATIGGGARTFDIERRVKGTIPISDWTKIDTGLTSASTKLIVVGTNTYQYVDVPPDTVTYEYRVTVKQAGAADVLSNVVSAKVASYFPYRPTDLHYTVGFGVVELDWYWQDGYEVYESGFIVERKGKNEPESSFIAIGSTSAYPLDNFGRFTDHSITDEMMEIEDTYHYRVRAYKGVGIWTVYSDYSDTIEVQVLPSPTIPIGAGGGGAAVGPLAAGVSALLGWWKRRKRCVPKRERETRREKQ
ncbi:MAG: hypothetical protein ABII89_05370 [Candidatus Omnitrophota bacterium]